MANSIITRLSNGSNMQFSLNFTLGILKRTDVVVRVGNEVDGSNNPVYRDIEWITDGLVNVLGAQAPLNTPVVFTRTVRKDQLQHDYANGSAIDELNLDESNKQTLMAVHEVLDGRFPEGLAQDLDMNGFKVTNMAPGTDPDDAVTFEQLGTTVADTAANAALAEASADAAAISEANAADSEASADADATQTASDRIQTAADRVQTGLDRVAVAADKVTVAADKATVAADKGTVSTDKGIVAADKAIVAADKATTLGYKNASDANVVLTNADVVLTHADVVLTHADVVTTGNNVTASAGSASTASTQAGIATGAASTATTQAGIATGAATTASNLIQTLGLAYNYDSATAMADPGSGDVRFNNATLSSVTAMAISATTASATSVLARLLTFDDSTNTIRGSVRFSKVSTPATYVDFNITGTLTNNTTWVQFTLAYVGGNGTLTNADALIMEFNRAGDKGADGVGTGDFSTTGTTSADSEMVVYSGTGMKTGKRSLFVLAGPATTAKTYTFPNATCNILTDNAAVTGAQGGTGNATYAVGDLLQASATSTLTRLAAVATGNALISGGVTTASSWGKIGLTTHVSGILPAANGGTNNGFMSFTGPTAGPRIFTLPDASSTILTSNALVTAAQGGTNNGFTQFSGPASTAKTFTLPNASATILTDNAAVTAAQGGTGQAGGYTQGDILYATGATTLAKLAKGTALQQLRMNAGATAPEWAAAAAGYHAKLVFDGTTNADVTGTYSQSGFTVTVSVTAHGLATGNRIQVTIGTGTAVTGAYTVTVVNANSFTYTAGTSLTTSGNITLPRRLITEGTNITCVSYIGTGNGFINFATAAPTANYVVTGGMSFLSGVYAYQTGMKGGVTPTTMYFEYSSYQYGAGSYDGAKNHVLIT